MNGLIRTLAIENMIESLESYSLLVSDEIRDLKDQLESLR